MKHAIAFILLMISFVGCKEKYDIKISAVNQPLLIVDGNLNSNGGTSTILLSKTVPIQDTLKLNTETAATITVEGKDNSLASLTETLPGTYTGNLNIIIGNEYRLRI